MKEGREGEVKKIRKRNRIPLSCSNCRKRKTKCDRQKPVCRLCEVHGLKNCVYIEVPLGKQYADVPTYTDAPHNLEKRKPKIARPMSETPVNNKHVILSELETLKQKLSQLESSVAINLQNGTTQASSMTSNLAFENARVDSNDNDDDRNLISVLLKSLRIQGFDRIQIYKGFESIIFSNSKMNNFGPFAWITIVLKDPFSKSLCKAIIKGGNEIIINFKKKAFSGKYNFVAYEIENENNLEVSNIKNSVLLNNIVKILPTKKAIWLFIERFFKFIYPFVPYLDQNSFILTVERLIDGNHIMDLNLEQKVNKLYLSQHTDIAVLGSLLVVIQFSYDSLLCNTGKALDHPERTRDELYLLNSEPSENLVQYTQLCLNQFKLLKRCPLPIFQCAMLLREYQKVDGCDGFADGDSQIYTGLLVQMATSIGLNRDPQNFNTEVSNDENGLLWRKIWYGLIFADNYQYMQTGTPPLIYSNHYDTKLPVFNRLVSNNKDLELENVTIEIMRERFFIENKMRDIADLVSNMNTEPIVEELLLKIFSLKNELTNMYGSGNDILTRDHKGNHCEKIMKVARWMIYSHALTLLQPVFMHVYFHYQSKGHFDTTYFFHNKILSFWMYVVGNLEDLVKNSYKFFGLGFDVLLVPVIEVSMHKGLIFFNSAYIKATVLEKKLKGNNADDMELLKYINIFRNKILLRLISDIYLPLLRILSNRYFYAWRMLKAHGLILKYFEEGDLDFSAQRSMFNFMEYLNIDSFKLLIETTNWKYYRAGVKQPNWLIQWLNNYERNIYSGPIYDAVANANSITSSDDSPPTINAETSINDLSKDDEIWIDKLYQRFSSNISNNFVSQSSADSNAISNNRMLSTAGAQLSNIEEFNTIEKNNEYSNDMYHTSENDDIFDIFHGSDANGLDFEGMYWIDQI